ANSLRGNYSTQHASVTDALDSFQGAVPIDPSFFLGTLQTKSSLIELQTDDTNFLSSGPLASDRTRQFNIADDLDVVAGSHQLKFGADYRAIFLDAKPSTQTFFFDATSVQDYVTNDQGTLSVSTKKHAQILTQTNSLYA